MNSGPDLNGLEQFVLEGDHDEPLHFAGREAEIQEIEGLLEIAKRGKKGQTRVITAAPGAGKTTLLDELACRYAKAGTARPVRLNAEFFADPRKVMKKFFLAVDKEAARRFGAVETITETNSVEASAGVGFSGTGLSGKGGYQTGRSTQHTMLPDTFQDAFEQLKDSRTPIVLLVDEAQNWGADQEAGNGGRISSLLSEAHQNSDKLPLLIIAAGLGDTCDALPRCGVSRLTANAKIPLEPLSGDEQREVCKAFFDRFRIVDDAPLRNEWIEALIQSTGGYPKHLTNALFGAAEALIAGDGNLAQASLDEALKSATDYRDKFHQDQYRPFDATLELPSAVLEAMPEGEKTPRGKIEDAIEDTYKKHPNLPERMPRSEVFQKLLHQGMIQDFGDGYDCPIPGMRKHVLAVSARAGSPTVKISAEAVPEPGM